MPLFILGLVVIIGLAAYLHFSKDEPEELEAVTPQKAKEEPVKDEPAKIIGLPNDLEKEKKKRGIKTGK